MSVIDKMLVCKLAHYSVAVHIESSLMWPNLLSHRAFIACSISTHTQPLESVTSAAVVDRSTLQPMALGFNVNRSTIWMSLRPYQFLQ